MRRAVLVWRRQAPDVAVIPTPVSQSQFYDHGRGATLEQVRGILQEYLAIFGYWRRGWCRNRGRHGCWCDRGNWRRLDELFELAGGYRGVHSRGALGLGHSNAAA